MLDGPVGLVGTGYIGHLFAQQFVLAGCEVRAWSPGFYDDNGQRVADLTNQLYRIARQLGSDSA